MSAQTHAVCSGLNIITSLSLLLVFLSLFFALSKSVPSYRGSMSRLRRTLRMTTVAMKMWVRDGNTHTHTLSHTVCVLTEDNPLKGGRFISGTCSFRVLVKAIVLVSVSEALSSNSQARSKHSTFLLWHTTPMPLKQGLKLLVWVKKILFRRVENLGLLYLKQQSSSKPELTVTCLS